MSILLTLIKHRATWRFLLVLGVTCGLTADGALVSQLEAAVCALLTCSG